MTASVASKPASMPENSKTWNSLKQAISATSGFNRWQSEHPLRHQLLSTSLDCQVRRYLRETLEALAY